MKTFNFIIILISISNLVYSQPIITSINPSIGAVGTIVTVYGENFNPIPANNILFFGATQATVITACDSIISVIVPNGASSNYISVTDVQTHLTAYSLKPFIITFSCNENNNELFAPKIQYPVGSSPHSISICDLDGDRKPDIIVANSGNGYGNTFSVYRNISIIGQVSLEPMLNFITNTGPMNTSVGDLNGDGKPDVVIINHNDNTFSVFKNISTIGNITFNQKIDFITGAHPMVSAISDFNGDGKLDLVVSNLNDTTISIFKNTTINDSISFSERIDYSTGINPSEIEVGDLDDDGKTEIIITNLVSGTISIYKNIGTIDNIQFSPRIDYSTMYLSNGLAIIDINDDNKLDIISGSESSYIWVFKNTSTNGNISLAPKIEYHISGQPADVVYGDFNGDGRTDIAFANYSHQMASVMINTSVNNEISFAPYMEFNAGGYPYGIAAGDIDGDGTVDLALANNITHTISILLNNECLTNFSFKLNEDEIIKIAPNPFDSQTIISINNKAKYSVAHIYNTFGMEVRTLKLEENETILKKGVLQPGPYFIIITLENKVLYTNKIIIY